MAIRRRRLQIKVALIFTFVLFFLGAQVFWWMIFLSSHINQSSGARLDGWKRDQLLFQQLLQEQPRLQPQWLALCTKNYPHLLCRPRGIVIRKEALLELRDRGHRSMRMFMYESLFFVLMIAGGLVLLAQSIRAERELKTRQSNFLSAVSHELRTPISTMRLVLDTLQYRELPKDKQERYLGRLRANLDRLHATFEQVLAAAMLEEHGQTKPLETKDLNGMVDSYLERHRVELEERGGVVSLAVSPSELQVQMEPLGMEIVLNNLIYNAIKHNPKSEKRVSLAVFESGRYGVLRVEDNGPGIPVAERSRIFEPFYRIGDELNRSSEGLGLGLYLVKSLSERMGGSVSVDASEEGCRFEVWLPRV
ncbi:MAG: HAMP domain-containing histidine kinase [Myxococcales bacterium]|nr:HAMP domain-containing histidine kinase [Myxococcales bacterium]